MSKYKDPRGIMSWDEKIPKGFKKYGLPNIFNEERCWHIKEADKKVSCCVFCGADSHLEAFENREDEGRDRLQPWDGYVMYRVVCLLCGAQGPARCNATEAVEDWNGGAA
jgi:hypothetical protein